MFADVLNPSAVTIILLAQLWAAEYLVRLGELLEFHRLRGIPLMQLEVLPSGRLPAILTSANNAAILLQTIRCCRGPPNPILIARRMAEK